MINILVLAAFFAVAFAFVYFNRRLRRVRNTPARWLGRGLTGLVTLVLLLVCGAAGAGLYKEHARAAPLPELRVDGSDEQIQRGHAIADSF